MIEYKGLRKLTSFEISKVKSIADNFFTKIDRKIKNSNLILDIKKHKEAGKRAKYSIHARLEAPNVILAAKQFGWDINLALNKTLENMRNEMKKKFKTEGIKRRSREITQTKES